MKATPRNTDKVRSHNLLDKEVTILGIKSGIVYFNFAQSGSDDIFFHCDENSFKIHFQVDHNIENIAPISKEAYMVVKARSQKFL